MLQNTFNLYLQKHINMQILQIIQFLQSIAPIHLQEDYDNVGLLTGQLNSTCTGTLICLDCTENVVDEAVSKNCNLIIAHHPIIFKGLKKINGNTYIERTVIKAIKNEIAIYAIHTNLDNVLAGVSGKMALMLGLQQLTILSPKDNILHKLSVFSPTDKATTIKNALYAAGAGQIGNYSECSFSADGMGSFTPNINAKPVLGTIGENNLTAETKIEVTYPYWLQQQVLTAMINAHPYEEVAYHDVALANNLQTVGSGVIGYFNEPISETEFLTLLNKVFGTKAIKHSKLSNKKIQKVALCGGTGSFLTKNAIFQKADAYVTADVKYHEFFDADDKLLLVDIGHYESEQFTIDLVFDILSEKFPNFAHFKTGINTNVVTYFVL